MALSPDQLEGQEFRIVWRGVDRHEVSAFLKRVATDIRELEARLGDAKNDVEEAKRSKEAAIAAAAQLPVPPALSTPVAHDDSDRFNELGDRIAGLLRTAEESADNIRSAAEEEAAEIRAQAESILEQANADAERIRTEAIAEVSTSKQEVEEARAHLDEELASTRLAAKEDRSSAQAALAEAKAAVSELLAEARSQSEFIRHEADEIVRVKVRTEMETAEKRMRILQLTEQSSRDRLVSAQAELTSALEKLQSDPMPELDLVDPDQVLDEARGRATRELSSGLKPSPFGVNSLDEVFEPQFYENAPQDEGDTSDATGFDSTETEVDSAESDAGWASPVDEVESTIVEADAEVDDGSEEWARAVQAEEESADDDGSDLTTTGAEPVDADEAAAEQVEGADDRADLDESLHDAGEAEVETTEADAETVEGEAETEEIAESDADADAETVEGEAETEEIAEATETDAEPGEAEETDAAPAGEDGFDAQAIMDETPGVVIEDSISTAQDETSPLDSVDVPDDSGELLEDAMASVPAAPLPHVENSEAIPAALQGTPPPPPTSKSTTKTVEDPLAKLVREAMQRAVDSARGDDL